MNLLKPIDYIVYKISWIYRAGMDRSHPEIWARTNFALLFLFNYFTIGILMDSAYLGNIFLPVCLSVYGFLFFYYSESRFRKIRDRYRHEPRRQNIWGGTAVIIYVVVSIGSFFGIIISHSKPLV